MSKLRLWRYEVDEVWGFEDRPEPPVSIGTVLVDRWKGNRTWSVHKLPPSGNMEYVGGWHAKLIGEYDGPVDEVLADRCAKPLHKACRCVRPRGHDGPCNCRYPRGVPT